MKEGGIRRKIRRRYTEREREKTEHLHIATAVHSAKGVNTKLRRGAREHAASCGSTKLWWSALNTVSIV